MINAKMIARIMGALFFIEAGFLMLCYLLRLLLRQNIGKLKYLIHYNRQRETSIE